jgi:redox-sensitive bicupin YhaK (pirin superfamily)
MFAQLPNPAAYPPGGLNRIERLNRLPCHSIPEPDRVVVRPISGKLGVGQEHQGINNQFVIYSPQGQTWRTRSRPSRFLLYPKVKAMN